MKIDFISTYYLTEVKEFKYKNYYINKNHNLLIFNNLFEIDSIARNFNLKYFTTGSCALILDTDIIYRDIQDIDIVIHRKTLRAWVQALKNTYDYYYLGDPLEFFKYCLNNKRLLPFAHKKNGLKLELAVVDDDYFLNIEIRKKFILTNIYEYILPLKMQKIKEYSYQRQRDEDDINFYSRHINKNIDYLTKRG